MKNTIDILAIVLPALLILFGLLRYFLPGLNKYAEGNTVKTPGGAKMLNGLGNLFILILLIAGIARYLFFANVAPGGNHSNPKPLTVSKHSETFNQSVESVLDAYYKLSDGFVKWDTTLVKQYAGQLKTALDGFDIDELKADTTGIYESALDPIADC